VVLKKSPHVVQGKLRSIPIDLSGTITALDPLLVLSFDLAHPLGQQAQGCELLQFCGHRFWS
jgi:hypothetical protein